MSIINQKIPNQQANNLPSDIWQRKPPSAINLIHKTNQVNQTI